MQIIMNLMKYSKRLISRIILECDTPLALRSGNKNIITDAEVAKDINGLPYIPGSSIAGVLRHMVSDSDAEKLFGESGESDGEGSRVIFSDAVLLGPDGIAIEGIANYDESVPYFLKYLHLPIRQHVRIGKNGTAEDGGKFDNEVVYAGTRFCFEMETVATDKEDIDSAKEILSKLYLDTFRVGGGTRNGYGAMRIVSCKIKEYDFCIPDQFLEYVSKSNSLASDFNGVEINLDKKQTFDKYVISLEPDDYFHFGSESGDDEADSIPTNEDRVVWEGNRAHFIEDCIVIPATSVKGALSHRLAFNFNKLMCRFADKQDSNPKNAFENEAVISLMGSEDERLPMRGALVFSDIILSNDLKISGFNHIRVDSFTSAAINGALFNEKAVYKDSVNINTEILICNTDFERNLQISGNEQYREMILEAFEMTLSELCNGTLPLGGFVNKGFGRFTGNYKRISK